MTGALVLLATITVITTRPEEPSGALSPAVTTSAFSEGSASAACPRNVPVQEPNRLRDSIAIAHFLGRQGFSLAKVAGHRGWYYSVIARGTSDGRRMLFNLRVCGDSVFSLDSAEDVGDYDPTLVSWISLGDSAVNGLLITYDIPLEGDVGTLVYLLKGSELSLVFNDAEGTCKPAELNDVDGDGSPELIVYSGDLSRGDCSNTCLIVLRRHFNMTPAWVDVRRWTGSAWVSADADYPTFYRRLADVYGEIASWLAGGLDHEHCKNVYWLRDPKAFENLASQARALVSNR